MTALLARYARFLLCYETAWISCIQQGVAVRNAPEEDPKYRVFKTPDWWMIKRPLVNWLSDFQPNKVAAIAVAEQLCRASGHGMIVVQNENNGMELSYEVSAQDLF